MYDWKHPDHVAVIRQRVDRLNRIRSGQLSIPLLKAYYRDHIPTFISDWGMTVDPRLAGIPGRTVLMPFVLFPKQIEWVEFAIRKWREGKPALTEKSRDAGVSWLVLATSVSLCLFYDHVTIGLGSEKEDKIDRSGDPDCLFYKGRMFLRHLPTEFRGGWDLKSGSAHMRLMFPETQSSVTGEAGKNIGRGGRKTIYFVDEAAHLQFPKDAEAALSQNTNCQHDVSSVNGTANPFAIKRFSGRVEVFTLSWRDDPRKGPEWYAKQVEELDPVILGQEVDMDYTASMEGIVIPQEWVKAAVGALQALGLEASGAREGAFDVADEGMDQNAVAARHGVELTHIEQWRGKGSDIYKSVERAFMRCDELELSSLFYDADGLGASVRGDARKINEDRESKGVRRINVIAFRGSGEVVNPEAEMIRGRKNLDFFENFKAQSYWALRHRFLATYRAVVEQKGKPFRVSDIISLNPGIKDLSKLMIELSQPQYGQSKSGKMLIEKKPDNTASPNLADAVNMLYAPRKAAVVVSAIALQNV